MIKCVRCNGTGWVWVRSAYDPDDADRDLCPDCNGKGKLTVEQEKELMRGYENEKC